MTPAGYTWQARLKPCRGLGGSPAARQTPGSQPLSARTSLKLPRCLECILDGTSVGPGEIRNDHHVLDIPGRDAERLWKLSPQNGRGSRNRRELPSAHRQAAGLPVWRGTATQAVLVARRGAHPPKPRPRVLRHPSPRARTFLPFVIMLWEHRACRRPKRSAQQSSCRHSE
jgi:hypothetical protein